MRLTVKKRHRISVSVRIGLRMEVRHLAVSFFLSPISVVNNKQKTMGEVMERNLQTKPKKALYKKWQFWLVVLIVIVAIASQAKGNTPVKVGGSDDSSNSQKVDEKTTFKVGDVIAFDKKEVIVKSVVRNFDTGNQFMQPKSGKEYVKVSVYIENKSDSEASYNTFDWKIEDSDGAIESQIFWSDDDSLGSGKLAKGGKKTGSVIFEVPKGSALKLHYEPSFWSSKKVVIEL